MAWLQSQLVTAVIGQCHHDRACSSHCRTEEHIYTMTCVHRAIFLSYLMQGPETVCILESTDKYASSHAGNTADNKDCYRDRKSNSPSSYCPMAVCCDIVCGRQQYLQLVWCRVRPDYPLDGSCLAEERCSDIILLADEGQGPPLHIGLIAVKDAMGWCGLVVE